MKKINLGKYIDHGGFTLLEVLVVLGIFSVISIVSFTMLSQYLDTTERLEEKITQPAKTATNFYITGEGSSLRY